MPRKKKVETENIQPLAASFVMPEAQNDSSETLLDEADIFESKFTGEEIESGIKKAKTAVQDNDPRLTDARTPKAHKHAPIDIIEGLLENSDTAMVERNPDTGAHKINVIGGGGDLSPITLTFNKNDFINNQYTILLNKHNKGYNAIIVLIELNDNGYENAVCDFKRLINGDIKIITNNPFDGRIIIQEG